MYTLSKFEQEVQKFANILGKDPTRGPSRILYVLELRKVSYKTNTLKGILLAQSIPFGENHQYLKRCANPNNTSCHAKSYLDIVHSGSSHDSIRLRRTVEATCRVPGVDVNIIGAFRKNKENTRITVYSTIRYYNEQLCVGRDAMMRWGAPHLPYLETEPPPSVLFFLHIEDGVRPIASSRLAPHTLTALPIT